jgi:hypothetical protein
MILLEHWHGANLQLPIPALLGADIVKALNPQSPQARAISISAS